MLNGYAYLFFWARACLLRRWLVSVSRVSVSRQRLFAVGRCSLCLCSVLYWKVRIDLPDILGTCLGASCTRTACGERPLAVLVSPACAGDPDIFFLTSPLAPLGRFLRSLVSLYVYYRTTNSKSWYVHRTAVRRLCAGTHAAARHPPLGGLV